MSIIPENKLASFYACIAAAFDAAHTPSPIVPVLMGPTGSGKTTIAVEVARQFPITAIVADLRQVMGGMEIGSAQPTADELSVLPHKLNGILDPMQDITVNDWRRLALEAIQETLDEGRIPLILGGSGMCIKALITGEKYDAPPAPILRKAINEWIANDGLKAVVETIEPLIAEIVRIDEFTNRQRVIRGVERYAFKTREGETPDDIPVLVKKAWTAQCEQWNETSETLDESTDCDRASVGDTTLIDNIGYSATRLHDSRSMTGEKHYRYSIFALHPNRDWLRTRIAARARDMFEIGLLDEVRALMDAGIPSEARALKGHGYPEAIAVLNGKMTIEEAIERTTLNTARYAKRQITWIKHQMTDVTWIKVGNS